MVFCIVISSYTLSAADGHRSSTCTYTYSDWGACQPNNTQIRTVLSKTPSRCTGTPVTTQYCNYVSPTPTPTPTSGAYTVIGWNDLGMHCMNSEFKEMAILPPYNNLKVQVLQKGQSPKIVTSGITVEYSIINNTTSSNKTDFWQYVQQLFGVALAPDMGLAGKGLSGKMTAVNDHFEAIGIPITPYDDQFKWNPYQRASVTVKDLTGKVIGSTEVVIPVSDELNCGKCHATGGVASGNINAGSLESNILTLHDKNNGTNLMGSRPVLCASCHSDNALGLTGNPALPSLSRAMHGRHSELGATSPGCYDCHPGPKTQCNRSAIEGMGSVGTNPNCEKCHGTLQQLAQGLDNGRIPWVQEPSCAQCHDSGFSTGTALYKNSKGHGGVYCEACHNSSHAWYPSKNALDNVQPIKLQGNAGPIGKCAVCHTNTPSGEIH